MPNPISVVTGDYSHTAKLKSMPGFAGAAAHFPRITPVHDAFDDMVRTQKYDVCEMAIGAFLQAHEAGKPLFLLPLSWWAVSTTRASTWRLMFLSHRRT
jgi:4,5-dihydroxyphthalate decarboxylase